MKRKIFMITLFAGVIFSACAASQTIIPSSDAPCSQPAQAISEPTPVPVKTVKFSASGDNLIHGSIYLQAQRRTQDGSYDFAPLYAEIAPFFENYDLNMINQETLVNDELPASTYPCFSTPGALGRAAYAVGFRLFSGANNHTYDKGAAGIEATLRFWDGIPSDALYFGLTPSGREMDIPCYEKNGITFACLAYTDHTNGIPTPAGAAAHVILTSDEERMEAQIRKAKEISDVVVVSVHWGVEDSTNVTDKQRQLAQKMTDWGADLIVGTHPHVLQTVETFTSAEDGSTTFCAYSLGNFVSAQSKPLQMIGAVLTLTITQQEGGEPVFSEIRLHPTVTHYGDRHRDISVLLLRDYTAERALQHGVRGEYPEFDRNYIQNVVLAQIPQEYLAA